MVTAGADSAVDNPALESVYDVSTTDIHTFLQKLRRYASYTTVYPPPTLLIKYREKKKRPANIYNKNKMVRKNSFKIE